ncbi:MAG: ABC transporter ATP-binding protein [Methanobacteriota archaeon]|nr:MAG: ABC transporter ATP-binding protein [Euryarchaeota archaeon]
MSDKTPAVLIDQASKWYGEVIGINDVSLAIDGGVTGVLGPNGAGKSTLFKLLMGRLKPNQGSVRLFGVDPWTSTAPYRRVGYVSESERMYDWMTGLDFVATLARLHGMTREEATARAEHVLDFVGLSDVRNKELGKYSKGMRQRVKIAHALVHDPDLIILDEPLHGCDPIARTSIMSVIRELGSQGKTVIISSHILEEIERITEQIVILHNGRLLALGNLHAIRALLDKHPHRILLTCDDPRSLASQFISEDPVYGVRFPKRGSLRFRPTTSRPRMLSCLASSSTQGPTSLPSRTRRHLESLLGYLTGGDS